MIEKDDVVSYFIWMIRKCYFHSSFNKLKSRHFSEFRKLGLVES